MSPLSGAVLGAAAVVASPALWMAGVEGTLPIDAALTRYLISVLLCWVALSVVSSLAFPAAAPVKVVSDTDDIDAATDLTAETLESPS